MARKKLPKLSLAAESAKVAAYMDKVRALPIRQPDNKPTTPVPLPAMNESDMPEPAPRPIRYNIFRRLIVPDVAEQFVRQLAVGNVLLRFPELYSARLRKTGDIMVPIVGRLQLRSFLDSGATDEDLKTGLEEVRTRLGVQADEEREGMSQQVGIRVSRKNPVPRLILDNTSSRLQRDRILADTILRQITGATASYTSIPTFFLPLADFPGHHPRKARLEIEREAGQQWPAGSRLVLGPMEIVDLQKDAERFLAIRDLPHPA